MKHITTIAGAHTIERFNRTLKENIQTRLDAMDLDRDKWLEQLHPIQNRYNNTNHATIEMSQNDAKKSMDFHSKMCVLAFHLLQNHCFYRSAETYPSQNHWKYAYLQSADL